MEKAAGICVVAMLAFVAAFALGAGPVPFIYVGEVLAPEIKGLVASTAMAANWLSNSAVAASFPMAVAAFGLVPTYGVYCLLNLVAVVFLSMFMPETAGLDMHAIQQAFAGSS
jgi:MFS transporter, SP family, galactose:H+ symporter